MGLEKGFFVKSGRFRVQWGVPVLRIIGADKVMLVAVVIRVYALIGLCIAAVHFLSGSQGDVIGFGGMYSIARFNRRGCSIFNVYEKILGQAPWRRPRHVAR